MAWEIFKRADNSQGSDEPFVTILADFFGFSALFVRVANITVEKHVTINVDCANRRLGFEFHSEKKPDSFALFGSRSSVRGQERAGLKCSSRGLVKTYPWIASVTRLAPKDRRFAPRKEGSLWVIQLCPAFEEKWARESAEIPAGACGIYRYVRENEEIVYIGRGEIKKRLAEPQRADWDFDRLEYSAVPDPDQQVRWETYWIDRFKAENGGKLPFYNRVSGAKTKDDP
jgi:hypothetical protein